MTADTAASKDPAERWAHLAHLQGLSWIRIFAALFVVMFHCGELVGGGAHRSPFKVGFVYDAIAIFFVISGFVMYLTTSLRPVSGPRFLRRRLVRIVPFYWFVTLAVAMLTVKGGIGIELPSDPGRLVKSLFFIPQWSEAFPQLVAPLLVVGWTLNLEIMFYALFAVSLSIPKRAQLPFLIGVLTLLASGRAFFGGEPEHAALALYTKPIIFDFAVGVGIAHLYLNGGRAWIERTRPWRRGLILVAIGVGLTFRGGIGEAVLPFDALTPGLFLVTGVLMVDTVLKPFRPAALLSEASYTIYICHIPLLVGLYAVTASLIGGAPPASQMIGLSLTAIVIGVALFLFVERPLVSAARAGVTRTESAAGKWLALLTPALPRQAAPLLKRS